MKIKVIHFLMILPAFAFIACSKNDETATGASIAGTWQWLRTDGGIAAHIHETPANTGKNIDLKISTDGTYTVYTNGQLSSAGTYTIETRKCIHDHANKPFINFSADRDVMIENLDATSLQVSDEAYDGVGSLYKRKTY
jgi:hypothetical protein